MANLEKNVRTIHWKEGMRVTGNATLPVEDYGMYLQRSGKSKQNGRKRKHLAKAFS